MPATPITRGAKAITIVPLALLSAAWTVSVVSTSAGAAPSVDKPLPGGASVPSQAIQAPASVPVAGQPAPAVPAGAADQVIASASTSGIPAVALAAYQRAAQIIDSADKTCNIPWELIAAIGRVESDHGRYDGNHLTPKGIAVPGIYGPELNGQNGTQVVRDTDGGLIDHDKLFDRAVGPMQFLPSTWQIVKVDADGDGVRNPQDINDASLAAAVYLCSGTENLATRPGQESAVFRYNHSTDYVNLVLRIMEAYQAGNYTAVPSGSYAGTLFTPSYSSAIVQRRHAAKVRHATGGSTTAPSSGTTTGASTGTTTGSGSTGTSTPSGQPTSAAGGVTSNPLKAVTDGVNKLASALPSPLASALAPVTDVLTSLGEATNFCTSQFAVIPDPLGLLKPLTASCGAAVQGKTTTAAASLIPNTLTGIVHWLTGK